MRGYFAPEGQRPAESGWRSENYSPSRPSIRDFKPQIDPVRPAYVKAGEAASMAVPQPQPRQLAL